MQISLSNAERFATLSQSAPAILTADFTPPTRTMKAKGELGWLHLCRIEAGKRTVLQTIRCLDKRQARKIAGQHGHRPWNF